jgi:hypothetical protein
MIRKFPIFATLALLGVCRLVSAEDRVAQEVASFPAGVKPRLVFSDSFERDKLTETKEFRGAWRSRDKQVAAGHTVALRDGRLVVKHLLGKHPLIVFYNLAEEDHMNDLALSVRFRLEGKKDGISIGFNGDNATEGHTRVCGVRVDKAGYEVSDTTGKGEHKQSKAKADITPGDWHSVFLVIQRDTATVRVDGLEPISLNSKGLACVKDTLKFGPSKGGSVEVDAVKLWSLDDK